ncbi:MAG: hypothetical protein IPN88_09035 [Bacteroidetes bacterium]|nr:hypothetical protein [Bacteroidota bacterium]
MSSEFTSDIVTFIDDIDMRLLINIFQEYKIYRAILDSDLKQDNLFAIIVYKNMYPADFGELSKRKGFLYSFFNNKNQYTKELTENLQTIVKKNENEISAINSEPDKSVKELRAVYINSLASKMPNFHSFYVNHKEVKLMEALEDENFSEIKSSQNIQFDFYYVYNHSSLQHQIKSSNIKFSDIEKTVSSISYEIREKWIMDKADGKVNLLKAENERIKNSIIELEGLSVKEIFEKTDISKYLDEFNDNYLVRSLLLNGYIDEYYDDYISLFHEVSLTKEDFSFERKVKGGINEKFDYELRKVETVIKRIPHQYFRRESILNYSLLECLLENKKTFEYKLDLFYKGLCNDGEKNFQFITGFINTKPKRLALFINQLCLNYSGLGRYIISKSGCPDDEIKSV